MAKYESLRVSTYKYYLAASLLIISRGGYSVLKALKPNKLDFTLYFYDLVCLYARRETTYVQSWYWNLGADFSFRAHSCVCVPKNCRGAEEGAGL